MWLWRGERKLRGKSRREKGIRRNDVCVFVSVFEGVYVCVCVRVRVR